MKIIAYSQVPQKHTYVHLAYLSAAAENAALGYASTGLFLTVLYLFMLVVAKRTKFPVKFARVWRWISIGFLAAAIGMMLVAYYGCSHSTR